MIEALRSEEIINKIGGRFKLTALIQRRMVEIMQGARPLVERTEHSARPRPSQLRIRFSVGTSSAIQPRGNFTRTSLNRWLWQRTSTVTCRPATLPWARPYPVMEFKIPPPAEPDSLCL